VIVSRPLSGFGAVRHHRKCRRDVTVQTE